MNRGARSADDVRREIVTRLAETLQIPADRIDPSAPFADYGLGSRDAVMLSGDLEEWLGTRVSPTLFYDHPSANALAEYIASSTAMQTSAPAAARTADPIAIVGIGCRFPGARDAASFKRLLDAGVDAVIQMPPAREALLGDGALDGIPPHGRWGGFVEDVDAFDAPCFGIGAAEAASMDPQQRWLLEVAWEALEDAGQPIDDLAGSRTGVFIGISTSDYALLRMRREPSGTLDAYFGTSSSPSVAAGRLAYQFGLQGPTMAVDTACSSSLVAVHLACQSLRLRECELALAGGVNLILAPETISWACRARILSESGRCRTFDRAADGYVRGEGCGVVVLKRLDDARAAGDRIIAVIRGSAVNHDGRSSGLTAPNGLAQQRVLLEALAQAAVAPEAVQYLEAHGTGTVLGDPIEIHAAGRAYCARRTADDPLVIGSVKTNIGHLEAAAGIAGLIKAALAVADGRIPPHLHLTEMNPYIAAEHLPVAIADGDTEWTPGAPRVAGVSSFGLSGTNAHVILEGLSDARREPPAGPDGAVLLPISARSETALRAQVSAVRDRLVEDPLSVADLCYTASVRRSHHRHRVAAWGSDAPALAAALTKWLDGLESDQVVAGASAAGTNEVRASAPLSLSEAQQLAVRFCEGARVRWSDLYPTPRPPVALPRYPFDRHRYWFGAAASPIAERLRAAAPEQQPALLRAYLASEVVRGLDVPASTELVDDERLSALGVDSLMAIDLSNKIAVDLGVTISPLALLDEMSIARLVDTVRTGRAGQGTAPRLPLPEPAAPGMPFPLSQAQERIWILDQLAGAQAAYVIPTALRIHGPLDVPRLERALAATIARHEALRTSICLVDGRPMQRTSAAVRTVVRVVDLEDVPPDHRAAEAVQRASDEAALPFDLSRAPLFRTTVYRIGPDDHLWFAGIHHIVADGASLAILMRDVLERYDRDAPPRGADDPVFQYSQFVAWEQRRGETEAVKALEAEARLALEGARPLNLPTDRARTPDRSFDGSSTPLHVPGDLAARLRGIARTYDTTLNSVLTAAFQVLLGRLAQQADVLVGTPLANRTRQEFESIVGCFANTGVIRTDVSPDRRFSEVLRSVHAGVRDAWKRQEVPFGRLVKSLGWREPGHNPFFDAFIVLNVPTPPVSAGGATFEPTFLTTRAAKFDLALFCDDRPEGIDGFLEYRHDLFDRETAARLLRQYVNLLGGVAEQPDQPIGDITFFDAVDLHVIDQYGDVAYRDFRSEAYVHDLASEQAARTPHAIAVSDSTTAITYAELDERSMTVAGALAARAIGRGHVVAVAMDRSIDLLVTLLGVLKAGAAYLPLDPSLPADRIRTIVADAGAVLVQRRPEPDENDPASGRQLRRQGGSSADLAYVIYTSGSTGTPKGVEVTHRNLVNLLQSMAACPGMTHEDVLLAVTPITFDIAALEFFLPLIVGGQVAIADSDTASDGALLKAAIASSGATLMQATPATWRMLAAAGYRPHQRLKVLCGGEALPADLAKALTSGGAEVWNMYGPTETTIWSTAWRVRPDEPPSLGRPIANTYIRILDDRRRRVAAGSPGEICIGGEGVARGYRHQPRLTADKFILDPDRVDGARLYRTGDIGCLRADGTLRFLGRSDDQIKIRGFRVELGEIESVLTGCAGVRQAAVIAHRAGPGDVRLVAFVRNDAEALPAEQYRSHLASRLPAYMMPSLFVPVAVFPLTPNGKIDRQALAVRAGEAVAAGMPAEQPARTPVEQQLAGIWAEVLSVPQVGVRSSFFDLGGHSLLAALVIARVETSCGVKLPLNLFYTAPTIAEHACYIEALASPPERPPSTEEFERLLTMVEGLSEADAAAYLQRLDTAQEGDKP